MPIKVQCACGKAFAAKDELAGKTVKCPGCQQPLKIPGASPSAAAAKAAASKPAAQAAAKPAQSKPAAPAATGASDLFDEIGLQAAAPDTRPCPGCGEMIRLADVICIKCGYNSRLGRRMETVKMGGGGGGAEGHGAVAQGLLDRAAQVIDEDKAEEIKKTQQGMPWWVFLVVLILLVSLGAFMLMFWGREQQPDEKGKKGRWEPRPAVERALVDRHALSSVCSGAC